MGNPRVPEGWRAVSRAFKPFPSLSDPTSRHCDCTHHSDPDPSFPHSPPCPPQIATVGKAETAFLPGVRVGTELAPTSAAARGGVLPGDVITRVGELQVPAGPSQVRWTKGVQGGSRGPKERQNSRSGNGVGSAEGNVGVSQANKAGESTG